MKIISNYLLTNLDVIQQRQKYILFFCHVENTQEKNWDRFNIWHVF